MAGFKLRIEMGGMCAFVPQVENGQTRLWAYLVDARQPDPSIPDMKPHGAVVQFRLGDVDGLEGVPSTAFGTWALDGQDLEILTAGRNGLKITGFTQGPLTAPSLEETFDRGHFGLVPSIQEACAARGFPSGGKIKPGLLSPTIPVNDRRGLLGRILFTEGTVNAGPPLQCDGRPILWKFRPPGASDEALDHRQYAAGGIELEIDIGEPTIEIQARRFDGSKRQRLVLRPSAQEHVRLTILNEESERITGLGVPDPIQPDVERPADRMFILYRALCADAPPAASFPIPVPDKLDPVRPMFPPTWGSPPCASGRMEVGP